MRQQNISALSIEQFYCSLPLNYGNIFFEISKFEKRLGVHLVIVLRVDGGIR